MNLAMNKKLENIIHKLIYTCERATYLIEKKASARGLSPVGNIRLKAHLAMCKLCKAYEKKVTLIDKSMIRISKKPKDSLRDSELAEFKVRIKSIFFVRIFRNTRL